jgi:hypothetical protein
VVVALPRSTAAVNNSSTVEQGRLTARGELHHGIGWGLECGLVKLCVVCVWGFVSFAVN